jgi:hypothetical protein
VFSHKLLELALQKTPQVGAYAQGNDTHLTPGQKKHLAHQAWRVVQQRQGRVKPTLQTHDSSELEKEAGVTGEIIQYFHHWLLGTPVTFMSD